MQVPEALRRLFTVVNPGDKGYRPDIDGLRAVAVLVVVAYHYFPGRMPGGFIGVDVFFVISGYLITGILARSFETRSFGETLLDFYQRRVRRIFPAVSLVLLFLLVSGWLTLFTGEYQALGKHIAAGAGFVENIVLWQEAGYFDADAITKPLLHFWSLAVEEQFYIFWPFILWFVMRRRWPVLDAISVIAIASFALNVWAVSSGHSTAAFYLPAMRAWELMAGAWLAAAHRQGLLRLSPWLAAQSAWLGLALIVVALIVVRPDKGFPGFWALLPILGTVLVINAGPRALANRTFLSWRPVVWFGLISYPLYLWHWALWSMTVKVFGDDAGLWVLRERKIMAFALSVLLSWMVYRWLEKPVRRRVRGRGTLILVLIMAVLGLSGLGIYMASGVPQRPLTLVNEQAMKQYLASAKGSPLSKQCFNLRKSPGWPERWSCTLGDPEAVEWVAVIGDSHSQSLLPVLDKYGKTAGLRVVYAGLPGCLALFDTYVKTRKDPVGRSRACQHITRKMAKQVVEQGAQAVVLIERWTLYGAGGKTMPTEVRKVRIAPIGQEEQRDITNFEALRHGFGKTLSYYRSAGIPIVLMEDNPRQAGRGLPLSGEQRRFADDVTDERLNRTSVTLTQHRRDQFRVNRLLEEIAARDASVSILNIDHAVCREGRCPWVRNGKFLYIDSNHLSATGAMLIYPLFAEHLNDLLNRSGTESVENHQ